MKTSLPATSISASRWKVMAKRSGNASIESGANSDGCTLSRRHHRHRRVEHAIGKAPFVVIPGGDLHEASRNLGQRRVEYRRPGVVIEIDRDELAMAVTEKSSERSGFGRGLHDAVHFLDAGIARRDEGEIDDRHVDCRH